MGIARLERGARRDDGIAKAMTKRAALKKRGFSKGGRQVPLWNEIIELYPPLPYR